MKPTKKELLDIIYRSLEEVNEQLPNDRQFQKSPDAILVGRPEGWTRWGSSISLHWSKRSVRIEYGITVSLSETSPSGDDAVEDVERFADSLLQRLSAAIPEV